MDLAVNCRSSSDMSGLLRISSLDIFDKSKLVLLTPTNDNTPAFNGLAPVSSRGSWMAFRGLSADFSASPISSNISSGIFLSYFLFIVREFIYPNR
jgi:hypothetical protein